MLGVFEVHNFILSTFQHEELLFFKASSDHRGCFLSFRLFLHTFELHPPHPSYTVDVIPTFNVHFRLDELIKRFKRGGISYSVDRTSDPRLIRTTTTLTSSPNGDGFLGKLTLVRFTNTSFSSQNPLISSSKRWIVDRATLKQSRAEIDLHYVDDPEYLDFLAIYFANGRSKSRPIYPRFRI